MRPLTSVPLPCRRLVCLFAAASDLPKICECVSDAQKDSQLWAALNAADANSAPAEKVNWNQFEANCKSVKVVSGAAEEAMEKFVACTASTARLLA